jgi:Flp pilus assembly pilin Flp
MVSAGGVGVVRDCGRRQRGAATLEYVLIAIVAGLVVMFAFYRFGGSVGGRFAQSERRVDKAITSGETSGGAEDTIGGETGGTNGGATSGSATTPADASEPTPPPSLRRQDGKVAVGNFEVDFSMVIWIGLLFLIVIAFIVMRVFAAAKAKPKVKVKT